MMTGTGRVADLPDIAIASRQKGLIAITALNSSSCIFGRLLTGSFRENGQSVGMTETEWIADLVAQLVAAKALT